MTSAYAVRRRLTVSLHRPFIDELSVRMRQDVVIEALMLADGDEAVVRAAIDRFNVFDKLPLQERDLTRVLDYLRRGGARA